MVRMDEAGSKPVIGLSWEPKLPPLPCGTKKGSHNTSPESSAAFFIGVDCALVNRFDMPAPAVTPVLKKDLQLLKLRSVIDPKRDYKKGDSKLKTLPKHFQVGTVIESALDFFAGRLAKKERKVTFADKLLSDHTLGEYRKRKVGEIEGQHRPGGIDKWKIKGRQSWRRAKQSRH